MLDASTLPSPSQIGIYVNNPDTLAPPNAVSVRCRPATARSLLQASTSYDDICIERALYEPAFVAIHRALVDRNSNINCSTSSANGR